MYAPLLSPTLLALAVPDVHTKEQGKQKKERKGVETKEMHSEEADLPQDEGASAPSAATVPLAALSRPVPAQTIAMDSALHEALVYDDGVDIVLWLGASVARSALRSAWCERAARAHGAACTPRRPVRVVRAGSCAERWLRCRLAPGHHDPTTAQHAAFPRLAAVSAARLARRAAGGVPPCDGSDPASLTRISSALSEREWLSAHGVAAEHISG